MKKFHLTGFIIVLLLEVFSASSQGLCTNSNFETGEFEISDVNICIPNLITIKSGSGVQNSKYIFDYQNENIEEVSLIAKAQNTYSYSDIGKPKVYTILQLAEKEGKISIACKNVNVRTNNEPVYSYTVCGSLVEFNLPAHPLNDFDKYSLEIGSGTLITIQKSDLPFSIKNTLSFPLSFKISGFYLDVAKNCPNPPSFKTIPAPSISRYLPFYPNIDKIELMSQSKVKIDYSGPYTFDPNLSSSLYRFEKNSLPSSAVEIKKNLLPGQYEFSIPDSSKSYCFFVKKNNICSATPEESAEICSHPITSVDFDPNSMRYELKWIQYPSTFKGLNLAPFPLAILTGISYNTSQKISIKVADINTSSVGVPEYSSSYNHNGIDCKKEYCYQVEQIISGTVGYVQYYGISKSNRICKNQSKVLVPAITTLYTSTIDNKNLVFIEDNKEWPLKKEKWYLYKKSQKGYEIIDSTINILSELTDKKEVNDSEAYKVSYIDQCNSTSFLSDSVSSVFLGFKAPNRLSWTKGNPFSDLNINMYELFYFKEDDGQLVKVKDIFLNETDVDLNPFNEFAKFLIKTNSFGTSSKKSNSNIVTYNIPPQIFIPNAFTPNGDDINDILEIKGKLSKVENFKFEIYNRFGQQVASLNDITSTWDGKFRGELVAPGVYSYKVLINLYTGEKYSKSGVIQVIR